MADTYTAALKARKIEQNAYSNSYAERFNADMVDVFDAGIAGVLEIDIGSATTYTLQAMQNGTLSETHYHHLRFVGTPASAVTITVPVSVNQDKEYVVENQTGQALTFKYAATSGQVIADGELSHVIADGTDIQPILPENRLTAAEIAAGVTVVDYRVPPHTIIGWVSPNRYGKNLEPEVTDMTSALVAAVDVAVESGCPILLNCETYAYTTLGNLAYQGLRIAGLSMFRSVLKCTNAAADHICLDAWAFESGSPTDPFINDFTLENLTVQGNSNSLIGIRGYGLATFHWRFVRVLDIKEDQGTAFMFNACNIGTLYGICCSTDLDPDMTYVPTFGIQFDTGERGGSGLGNSTNITLVCPRFEGMPRGMRLVAADQITVLGGTPESNTIYGLTINTNCRWNTFKDVGFESVDGTADIVDLGGDSTTLENCYSAKAAIFQGRNAKIDGGMYERIQIDASAIGTHVERCEINHVRSGSGGYFDSGAATTWSKIWGGDVTASFATSVMTVTAVGAGTILKVGQVIRATGVADGTTIASLGTGTGGAGTYNLSTSPGTLSSRAVQTVANIYPLKDRVSITVGASPFLWENETGQYVDVVMQTGTVSEVLIYRNGSTFVASTAIPGRHQLAPSDKIRVEYSVTPLMSYLPQNGFQG